MRPEGNNPENKNEVQTPRPNELDVRVGTSSKFRAPFYIKKLREQLKDHTGGKVNLSNKKVIMIKCQSLEEMEADLADLGFGHLVNQVKGEQ